MPSDPEARQQYANPPSSAGTTWEEISAREFAEKAAADFDYRFMPPENPDHIELTGPCPRCGDDFYYEWPLEIVRSIRSDSDPGFVAVTIYCQCESGHVGRPDDEPAGCGAYWNLDVPDVRP